MSDDHPPRNTAGVKNGEANVEKHEVKPVHIALIIDTTGSRIDFIEEAKLELHRQMEQLRGTVEEVSSIENLQITLATFGGGTIKVFNTFDDPVLVAEMFDEVECVEDLTRICDTLGDLKAQVKEGNIPDIDAAVFIGDTTDGSGFDLLPNFEPVNLSTLTGHKEPYMVPNVRAADTDLNLFEAGKNFGGPIITMLHASYGTKPNVNRSFELLSSGSGLEDCPLMYNADITFADYMLATAAMVAGPQAIEELKENALVDPEVWENIKPGTIESVHEPVEPQEPIIVYQDRVVEKEIEDKRRIWPRVVGSLAIGGLIGCLLCGHGEENDDVKVVTELSEPEIIYVPVPVPFPKPYHHTTILTPSDGVLDEFRRSGSETLDDITSPVNFQVGSAQITPSFAEFLDRMGELLERNPENLEVFVIEGHASKLGSNSDNMVLSKQRALAVLSHLQTRFDIEIPMHAVGCGEEDLAVDPENTPEDSRKNRRVVFQTEGVEEAELRGCEIS